MKNSAIKAACIGLLASPLLLMSEPASAGSNGQQLAINTGWGSGSVQVQGYNQSWVWSKWSSRANGTAYTNNSWWKSTAKITVKKDPSWLNLWKGASKTCYFNVRTQWWSNWYSVSCKP
jgi:hypothetical protein